MIKYLFRLVLNIKIIAEGVKTLEQYQYIKQLGCHEIQGYYFYKTSGVAEVQALLEKRLASA